MSFEAYAALGAGSTVLLLVIALIAWKVPRRLKSDYFVARWKKIQERCADKTQWPLAIAEADDLLNEALRKKRYKGKNMGERMVEAQKNFTNNDAVWFGHKLRTRLQANPEMKLVQDDVQKALVGLRQALKDIGAIK